MGAIRDAGAPSFSPSRLKRAARPNESLISVRAWDETHTVMSPNDVPPLDPGR
jgi:hypothetical protein